ncbi:hypothetical protein BGP77_01985 [Saccharospirillum sp. MSK14-1]|uniref:GNAT family N-acetyltransferase n=1 Tax=Saccharospirillum sp. MSK14-1 TaxID=1897632 RepID=UPI000D3496C0|nr:GNAT family N-acetyltransferase [Saccharospirillum sp. MSK14-1]PTY36111.1 hypothetical protein BGP77_01985 [Saccharospirillum sp. MSK14-1]
MVEITKVDGRYAERLAPLNQALIAEEGSTTLLNLVQLAQRLRHWLDCDYQCLAVFEGERLVGYCLFALEPDRNYIRQLYVVPDRRRCGYGRLLLERAETMATPGKPLHLEVLANNDRVLGFYQKLGYLSYVYELRKQR